MKTPVFFIILIFSALSAEVDIFLDVVSDIMTEFRIKCATFIQDDIRKSELKEMIINSKAKIKIPNLVSSQQPVMMSPTHCKCNTWFPPGLDTFVIENRCSPYQAMRISTNSGRSFGHLV